MFRQFSIILLVASLASIWLFTPTIVFASPITRHSIINFANAERITRGLPDLDTNQALNQAAANKAIDMAAGGYFEHYTPTGKSPWEFMIESGYQYTIAGENLAMDFKTAEGTTAAWMNSPSHRANLLNPDYTDIGVAAIEAVVDDHLTTIVVQMFGSTQLVKRPTVIDRVLDTFMVIRNLFGI